MISKETEDNELVFERQEKPSRIKQIHKIVNMIKGEKDPLSLFRKLVKRKTFYDDQHEEVPKNNKKKTNISEQNTDVTVRRGKSVAASPVVNEEEEEQEEHKKESRKPLAQALTEHSAHLNRFSIFTMVSTLTKSTSIFWTQLKNSHEKTKTQQFLEKTILMQKVKPKDMCEICQLDDFIKIKTLGQGSNGIVEKQYFKPLKQEVAMKKYLKDDKEDEFNSEVFIMKEKQSEYVPKLIYYHHKNLSIYMELGMITLEIYEGYLRKHTKGVPQNFAIWMLKQLLQINYYMFKDEYHHSDIKPANIIITFNENQEMIIKFIDFGAASVFPEDYWIQYTPLFQCPKLVKKTEKLERKEIFYAEFFASCRSIQLLTLANHPKRSHLFRLSAIEEYLADEATNKNYDYLMIILRYIYKKNLTSLNESDYTFLHTLLNLTVNPSSFQQDIEEAYQYSNYCN